MHTRLCALRKAPVAAVLATAILALVLVGTAAGAPSDPTLGLSALKTKLDAAPSGTIAGYFKTVDRGSTIETIPVTIVAITGNESANSALIMFEATGSQIDKFGGIVAGMSGSPVYVTDGGIDKVVGAVSYGDYFTKGGTGLATPIDSMLQVQSSYAPTFVRLSTPVVTTDGVVKDIIVAPNPQNFSAAAKQGSYVAVPLASVFVGGLDPNSLGYKLAVKDLANRRLSTVALSAPLASSPSVGDQGFSTPLVPGAAIAALQSRGDMWIGGVGTLTYTDGAEALAFGHPAYFTGPTSLYLTNAWIDSVWPSTFEPYKVARVGALRGTFTQDRSAGILGQIDSYADETTFTATVTDDDRSAVGTSAVFMPRTLVDSATIDPIMCALGVYPAGARIEDAQATPGSAEVTTTIKATDGTTVYTITMPNVIDDGSDVVLKIIQDAATAINELQAVPTDGVHSMQLLSVDMRAHFVRHRRWAKIVGVKLPHGLRIGANRVNVQAIAYGEAATQTIPTTLTVPAGTSLSGNVFAFSQSVAQNSAYDSFMTIGVSTTGFDDGVSISIPSSPRRMSLAAAVDELNAQLPNNVIGVEYVPVSDSSGYYSNGDLTYGGLPNPSSAAAVATATTPWAVSGAATIVPTQMRLATYQSTVGFRGFTFLFGNLIGPSSATTIGIYATPAGGAERLVRTLAISGGEFYTPYFQATVGGFTSNTTYRARYDGNDYYSPAEASVLVRVRASVRLTSSKTSVASGGSVTLTSKTWSAGTAGGKVVFEYNDHARHWRAIATRELALSGGVSQASLSFKPAHGSHKVRARFLGGPSNAASTSNALTITGK